MNKFWKFWDTSSQQKKIFVFIMFLLSIVLISALIIIGVLSYQDSQKSVKFLNITNVTDTSFSVVWQSQEPYIGGIVFQEADKNWPIVFAQVGKDIVYDDRDVKLDKDANYVLVDQGVKERYTHHVTLRNLKPDTEYSFRIAGAINGYTPDISDPQEATVNKFKTKKIIEDLNTPDPAYGLIEGVDSDDSVVILNVLEDRTENTILSDTIAPQNTYSIDINPLQIEEFKASEFGIYIFNSDNVPVPYGFELDGYKPLETIRYHLIDEILKENSIDLKEIVSQNNESIFIPKVCAGVANPPCTSCAGGCNLSYRPGGGPSLGELAKRLKQKSAEIGVPPITPQEAESLGLIGSGRATTNEELRRLATDSVGQSQQPAKSSQQTATDPAVQSQQPAKSPQQPAKSPQQPVIDSAGQSQQPTGSPQQSVTRSGAQSGAVIFSDNIYEVGIASSNAYYDFQNHINKISASSPASEGAVLGVSEDDDHLTVEESGRYVFFQDNEKVAVKDIVVEDGEAKVKIYYDDNGNGKKDPEEKYIEDYTQIKLAKEASAINYNLSAGWNLLNLPMVDAREENPVQSASRLLDYWNDQGAEIVHVARFRNGKFEMFSARKNEGEEGLEYANDFDLIPGEGLFVLNYEPNTPITFSGHRFEEAVKLELNNGWNLVGIVSPGTDYNSESFLEKVRSEGFEISTVTEFENGIYNSVIKAPTYEQGEEILFGNNFNIIEKRGYFIKIEKGGGGDFTP